MADRSTGSRPRNVSLQEQRLAQAQKQLERIDRMREEMTKQVELEMQRLDEMRDTHLDFTQSTETTPSIGMDSPASFQPQYNQFSSTKSNERLKPIGNESVIDFTGKLESPKDDEPSYSTFDRAEHYNTIDPATDLGKDYYVSGYYFSSGRGTKEYEYELRPNSGEIKVGDMVEAPVHLAGWHEGRTSNPHHHNRRFVITDIYTKARFPRYHDKIE